MTSVSEESGSRGSLCLKGLRDLPKLLEQALGSQGGNAKGREQAREPGVAKGWSSTQAASQDPRGVPGDSNALRELASNPQEHRGNCK